MPSLEHLPDGQHDHPRGKSVLQAPAQPYSHSFCCFNFCKALSPPQVSPASECCRGDPSDPEMAPCTFLPHLPVGSFISLPIISPGLAHWGSSWIGGIKKSLFQWAHESTFISGGLFATPQPGDFCLCTCLGPLRWATTTGTSCGAAGQVFPTTRLTFGGTGFSLEWGDLSN